MNNILKLKIIRVKKVSIMPVESNKAASRSRSRTKTESPEPIESVLICANPEELQGLPALIRFKLPGNADFSEWHIDSRSRQTWFDVKGFKSSVKVDGKMYLLCSGC